MEKDENVIVIRNFASSEEVQILKNWQIKAVEEGQFVDGITGDWDAKEFSRTKKRLTNRMSKNINYPDLVQTLQDRICQTFPILSNVPLIEVHGKDGVVVSVTYNDGDVYKHKDPSVGEGVAGLRCNILASKAQNGGTIHVEDKNYDLNEGDMMCYLVTELYHSVEVCNGDNPRALFMFGFVVDKDGWNNQRESYLKTV
jgi:hypothetical protein